MDQDTLSSSQYMVIIMPTNLQCLFLPFLSPSHTHSLFLSNLFSTINTKMPTKFFSNFCCNSSRFFLSVIVQCVYVKCFRFQQTLFLCPKIRLHENVVLKRLQQQIVPLFSNSSSMLIICLLRYTCIHMEKIRKYTHSRLETI